MSTASSLEREIECPASAALSPQVRESSAAAERGTAIHVFCRSVIAGTPRALALAAVPEGPWRETCEQIDFGVLCAGLKEVRAEVSYRITTRPDGEETVRELGVNLNRAYPRRETNDVDGTNDFEGVEILSGAWSVTDIKTGFWPVTSCERNPQMMFHARALMLRHDVDRVVARIAYVGVGGEISWDVHAFTRFELDLYADKLAERKARIERANEALRSGGKVTVNAGSWCQYCPAYDVCPKNTALAHAMVSELRETHAKWGAMTDQEKALATVRAYEARDLAERVIESMKTLARVKPIDLPGGKQLRDVGTGIRIVNAPKAERRRKAS